MSKKHTIEYIRDGLKHRGFVLCSKEYINAHSDLDCICPNGHKIVVRWNDFKKGHGCPVCAGVNISTISEIKHELSDSGFLLLDAYGYVNADSIITYSCPEGHVSEKSLKDWRHACRCRECSGRPIITIEHIASESLKSGYELLSDEYIHGKKHKLKFRCINGHEFYMRWNDMQQGYGCAECYNENNHGENANNWKGGISKNPYCSVWYDKEYMNDIFERDNFTCQNPCCSGEHPDNLVRHHIEYDKLKCGPKDIITLCRVCHGYTGANRDWHMLYFQTLMNHKYGYEY